MRSLILNAAFPAACLAAALLPADAAETRRKPAPAASLADLEIETIAVSASAADSNFTVIDSRFDETATAGALLGVLGASINSGINAGEDDKKADPLRAGAAGIDIAGILTKSAGETLAARQSPPVAETGASHTLVIEIHNWGLIRASRDDPRLRAFLNLSWKIEDAKGKALFEKKRENAVAPELRPLADHSDESLKADVEALAAKAGALIAYQIIYR